MNEMSNAGKKKNHIQQQKYIISPYILRHALGIQKLMVVEIVSNDLVEFLVQGKKNRNRIAVVTKVLKEMKIQTS